MVSTIILSMSLKIDKNLSYSLTRAAEVCDLSPHTVDYLCRSGVVVPSGGQRPGRGNKRQYVFGDLVLLRIVARLLKQGITVAHLRQGFEELSRLHPDKRIKTMARRYLVTDGVNLYFRDDCNVFEDLNKKGQLVFAFIVDLAGIEAELDEKLTVKKMLRPRRARALASDQNEAPLKPRAFGHCG